MFTTHKVYFTASQNMRCLNDGTVDLVVTSPPYPMIQMWDEILGKQNPAILDNLENNPGLAFELMHQELDKVWRECYRLLKDGGFMCVNIGDATRTINKEFQLYNNSARIVKACLDLGFVNLPNILWRKQTNAPNKFMGSGMLPCGAYVTLEHEWILIFRKGSKRSYKKEQDKTLRRMSSFFWEERNKWFSDLWEIKGVKQKMLNTHTRERNASYPLEVPFRLINMYSQQGDVVLDPFFGLGTTTMASMLAYRNSVGVEIDAALRPLIESNVENLSVDSMNAMIYERYVRHVEFVAERERDGKEVKYFNENMKCKVMTSQETDMNISYIDAIEKKNEKDLEYVCTYMERVPLYDYVQAQKDSLFYFGKSNKKD